MIWPEFGILDRVERGWTGLNSLYCFEAGHARYCFLTFLILCFYLKECWNILGCLHAHLTTEAHPPPWRLLPSLGLTNIGVAWVLEKYTRWPLDCDKLPENPGSSCQVVWCILCVYIEYDEYILMYTRVNDSRTFPIVPVLQNIVQHCVPLAPEA